MTPAASLLGALKIELGIVTDAYDTRLTAHLQNAQQAIQREGADLQSTPEDDMLTIQYAAWTWRHRDSGAAMPRMLRWALNNRIFSEHMKEA